MTSMSNKKLTRSHRKIDTIKCECGKEIMVTPDIRAMGEAIEIHVAMHIEKMKPLAEEDAEANRLRDDLIAQLFNFVINKFRETENGGNLVESWKYSESKTRRKL